METVIRNVSNLVILGEIQNVASVPKSSQNLRGQMKQKNIGIKSVLAGVQSYCSICSKFYTGKGSTIRSPIASCTGKRAPSKRKHAMLMD